MNKKRLSSLFKLADKALKSSNILEKDSNKDNYIKDSYNGLTASFIVTIATNGLLPALVIYYQNKNESRKVSRKPVLDIIATMMKNDSDWNGPGFEFKGDKKTFETKTAKDLLEYAFKNADEKELKKEVLECAIALKQVIRTYNLI